MCEHLKQNCFVSVLFQFYFSCEASFNQSGSDLAETMYNHVLQTYTDGALPNQLLVNAANSHADHEP